MSAPELAACKQGHKCPEGPGGVCCGEPWMPPTREDVYYYVDEDFMGRYLTRTIQPGMTVLETWYRSDHPTLTALRAQVETLREALTDAIGLYQVTHIHARIRAALSAVSRDV